jgi:Enoyl-(Acyl carrier protein) reductase
MGTTAPLSPRSTSAAKHAVEGITKSVALEIAKSGIRVNAVAPGPTDTGMLTRFTGTAENKAALAAEFPLGRLGHSDEVADGIVFIASDDARFITAMSSTSTVDTASTDPVPRSGACEGGLLAAFAGRNATGSLVVMGDPHAASAATFGFALSPIRWQIAKTRSARFIV